MKVILKYLFVLFVLSGFIKPEDLKKSAISWFKQVNETYKQLDYLSFDTEYIIYKGHDSNIAHETSVAHVKRKGVTFYNQIIEGIETIQNKDLLFIKDDSSKMIILKNPITLKQIDENINIDFAINAADKIEKISRGEKISGYSLGFDKKKGMDFKKLELLFNEDKKVLCEILVLYNTKINFSSDLDKKEDFVSPKLKIIFKNIKSDLKISNDYFSTDKYLIKSKKGWVLKPAYRKYKLVDQTNSNMQ